MERNVPKLRFKGFNDEWIKYKAENLFENISDKNHNGELNVLSVTQDKGVMLRSELDIDIKFDTNSLKSYKKVKDGDFIISLRSFQGGIETSNQVGLISPAYTVFNFNEKDKFNTKFMGYIFKSENFIRRMSGLIYGIRDGKAISFKDFSTMNFKIPSLQEQERIANFLTKVDKIIEKQDEKVKNLEKYKKGMMQKIFSQEIRFKDENGEEYPEWEEKKLSDVTIFENGKGHEQFIIEDGDFVVVNSKFISSAGKVIKKSSVNLCPLNKNDIVFVMSDVPNGKALAKCYYIEEDNKYTLNQRICSLKVLDNANSKYIFYLINRNRYYLAFDNGVGQTNLRKDEVLNCPITIPSLYEQDKIAKLLTKIDLIIENENNKFKKLKQWKKGLLQQMFV